MAKRRTLCAFATALLFHSAMWGQGSFEVATVKRSSSTVETVHQTSFAIPNLDKETERVAISSVVLSGQRLYIAEAIYSAQKGKQQEKDSAGDPQIVNSAKLVPSVTRVFSRFKPLLVFFQAY